MLLRMPILTVFYFIFLLTCKCCASSLQESLIHFFNENATVEDSNLAEQVCVEYEFRLELPKQLTFDVSTCSKRKRRVAPIIVVLGVSYVVASAIGIGGLGYLVNKHQNQLIETEAAIRELREQVRLQEISRSLTAMVHDPTYENVRNALVMDFKQFSTDFNVPEGFVEQFWNSFQVTVLCTNQTLSAFQVCGDRNPSRRVGVLHKTLPHGRIQTGKRGHLFREFDVPKFALRTTDGRLRYADECLQQNHKFLCVQSRRCEPESMEDCGVHTHVMRNGTYIEIVDDGVFVATVFKEFQLYGIHGGKSTMASFPTSGMTFLTIQKGSYVVIGSTIIHGRHVNNTERHIGVAINVPDLSHVELDKLHEMNAKTVEEIDEIKKILGLSSLDRIWNSICDFFTGFRLYLLLLLFFIVSCVGIIVICRFRPKLICCLCGRKRRHSVHKSHV